MRIIYFQKKCINLCLDLISPPELSGPCRLRKTIDQVLLPDNTHQEPEMSPADRPRGSVGLVGLLATLLPSTRGTFLNKASYTPKVDVLPAIAS